MQAADARCPPPAARHPSQHAAQCLRRVPVRAPRRHPRHFPRPAPRASARLFGAHTRYYLAFELAVGGELFDRIRDRGRFTEKDAAECIR